MKLEVEIPDSRFRAGDLVQLTPIDQGPDPVVASVLSVLGVTVAGSWVAKDGVLSYMGGRPRFALCVQYGRRKSGELVRPGNVFVIDDETRLSSVQGWNLPIVEPDTEENYVEREAAWKAQHGA